MDETLKRMLVNQYHQELENENFYRMLASETRVRELDGFCKVFREQADEEHDHAIRFFNYLLVRRISILQKKGMDITIPKTIDPKGMVELSYQKEKENTKRIREVYNLAEETKDTETMEFLDWFVKEQTEEENKFNRILMYFVYLSYYPQIIHEINITLKTFQ